MVPNACCGGVPETEKPVGEGRACSVPPKQAQKRITKRTRLFIYKELNRERIPIDIC